MKFIAIDMERRNWRKLEGGRLRATVQLLQQIWLDEVGESSKAGDFEQRGAGAIDMERRGWRKLEGGRLRAAV